MYGKTRERRNARRTSSRKTETFRAIVQRIRRRLGVTSVRGRSARLLRALVVTLPRCSRVLSRKAGSFDSTLHDRCEQNAGKRAPAVLPFPRPRDNPRRQAMAISVLRVSPSPWLFSRFRRKKEVNANPRIYRGPISPYLVSYGPATTERIILLRGSVAGNFQAEIITKVRRESRSRRRTRFMPHR